VNGLIISDSNLYTVNEVTIPDQLSFNEDSEELDLSCNLKVLNSSLFLVLTSEEPEDIEGKISDMNDIPVLV
jgi:hypothetical protein